ncbi:MAG TPA: hypothetical protein PK447_08180 [Ignavibacteria bacterium]|nr:hypothetical protein [Ignavibacteria bacterium]
MKPIFVYEELKKRGNFELANEVLNCLKKRTSPDIYTLRSLSGIQKAESIQNIISKYFRDNYIPEPKIRQHDFYAPDEIYRARTELENDRDYQAVHIALLCNEIPDIKNLQKFYGNYSESVYKIFKAFIDLLLTRKCDLTAAAHLNRVGGVCVKLKFNDEGKYEYGTLAAIHDTIEDLLPLLKNRKGNVYNLENYDEFLEDYIPQELQDGVRILTNHYNLILDYILNILSDEDRSVNKQNIIKKLGGLHKKHFLNIGSYVDDMTKIIENFEEPPKTYISELRWKFYEDLYLKGIAKEAMKLGNYRIFEIKGVDLSDNSHGKEALSLDGRIRNINKNVIWAKLGQEMKSTWIPLNNHIRENLEDSYISADTIILMDLLEPQSSLDFVTSSLHKFSKLEEVFYI